jgi:hypothetical protein
LAATDAPIAAAARSGGAVIVTGNVKDFPMPDVRVNSPRP